MLNKGNGGITHYEIVFGQTFDEQLMQQLDMSLLTNLQLHCTLENRLPHLTDNFRKKMVQMSEVDPASPTKVTLVEDPPRDQIETMSYMVDIPSYVQMVTPSPKKTPLWMQTCTQRDTVLMAGVQTEFADMFSENSGPSHVSTVLPRKLEDDLSQQAAEGLLDGSQTALSSVMHPINSVGVTTSSSLLVGGRMTESSVSSPQLSLFLPGI